MSPEDYQLVQEKFLNFRGLPAVDRQRALDALDEPLRKEVASLLASDQSCGSFLGPREGESPGDHASDEHRINAESATNTYPIASGTPETIGRYRLLQKIGEGGHGSVYMAEQQEPVRRKVAVKLIKPGMDSKQVLARFHAEQQALAMMDHASIAKVFDAGVSVAGTPYFVMELVKGVPIHEFCERIDANLHERLQLFLQVCDAVHHAHRKGIIHRDLKPSNVLVTMGEGEPIAKVIDFGIAKALDQRLTSQTLYTEYGQMIGTLEYMSPEQAEMSAVEIDTRSDVYALGVLLYQLLTGETPISRDQLLKHGVFEIPRLLRETEPQTPSDRITGRQQSLPRVDRGKKCEGLRSLPGGDLDWIVLKALAKDRRRRYDSVLDLARDVGRFLQHEPVEAHPPSMVYRAGKAIRRHWVPLAMGAVVLAGALLGLVGLGLGLVRARDALALAEQERRTAVSAQQAADASRLELAETVYSELIESAWRATRQQKHARARALLDRSLPEMRGWEWSLVGSRLGDTAAFKQGPEAGISVRQLDVHGQRAACVVQGGRVEIWDLATGNPQQRLELSHRANVVRWSHDGEFLFVGTSQGRIVTVDAADGRTLSTCEQNLGGIYDISVGRAKQKTAQTLAVCSGAGWMERFTFDDADAVLTSTGRWQIGTRLSAVTFHANDQQLLGAGFDGQLYLIRDDAQPAVTRISKSSIYDVISSATGEVVLLTADRAVVWTEGEEPRTLIELDVGASAISAGERGWVAIGGGDGSLLVKDLSNDGPVRSIVQLGSAINDLAWVPFREQFLVALSDGRVLWTEFVPTQRVPTSDTSTTGIVLTRHSSLITFDDAGMMSRFDLATGKLLEAQQAHGRSVWSVAADRKETILVSVGEDQRIMAWDLPELTPRFSQPIAWGVRDVCVDPGGTWIASAPNPAATGGPREGTLAIRDARTGEAVRILAGHENWVLKLATNPDGTLLASSGEFTNTRLWNVATGEQVARFDYDHRAAAPQMTFDPSGERVYLGHRDGWVTAWCVKDGEPVGEWHAFGDVISGLEVTAAGRVVATSQSSADLRVYDFVRQRQLASLDLGMGLLLRLHLADEDRLLSVVGEDRQMRQLRMP